ncbi:MAG TPA: radical SAM family heme chaperone HemW [Dermatophilaceae bacterium]|nr:radical SAM family heme chaperone HemW [Dermatophilaceae bacterium]
MPSALPEGQAAPPDGSLPAAALDRLGGAPFGVYVHVPFCRVRCGYCDFNTYTLGELAVPGDDARPVTADRPAGRPADALTDYLAAVLAELDLAVTVLGPRPPRVDTVFFGGGTPTLLAVDQLGRVLHGIRERFGLAPDAEVTTEANPDSVDEESLAALAAAGFTRVSLGMQSAVPHVLATLDRTHDPANVTRAVRGARTAGLGTSLDLIYGTPGESEADWRTSLDAAVGLEPDHVSAYALVVEEGTRLAGQVRRGEVARPCDDDEAAKYELADTVLAEAGYHWYEISNWARTPADRCRHNQAYWRGAAWWGAGPGAHSHVGGVRWWNVKHPGSYAARLAAGASPAAGRETLTEQQRHDERVLLRVRLADGLPLAELRTPGRHAVAGLVSDGLVDGASAVSRGAVVLTRRGRLLADTVVRQLLAD